MSITLEQVKKSEEITSYIRKADESLSALGFTEHSFAHVGLVSAQASAILKTLGYDDRTCELAAIAGWLHDIGNVINRIDHAQSGATILIVSHSMEDISQIADRLLVMDHARVLFCDTPREVFSHADEIVAAGLDIPMITKVMLELKKRGHDVDTSVYTVAQAMDALRACKRKEAAHEC